MHSTHTLSRKMNRCRGGATILALVLALGSVYADVSSSFETTNGTYSNGADIVGKQDTSLGGTWTALFATPTGVLTSGGVPYNGALAIHLNDAGASAYGSQLQLTNAASMLSSPFAFSIAMNVQSVATATSGQQVQIQFGASTFGSGSSWLKFGYDGFYSSGLGANRQTYFVSAWNGTGYTTKYIDLTSVANGFGEYVSFNFTIDPTTHGYSNATVTGSKGTMAFDMTGLTAWDGTTTPSNYLSLVTGGSDEVVVDFDAISVSSVPEPSVAGLLVGGLLFGLARRRRS